MSYQGSIMFKGMHNILNKMGQKQTDSLPPDPSLYPILSAKDLLVTESRENILKKLPTLSAVSHNEYNLLYLKSLYNFAEFAQNLPETKSSYYSRFGGLLDHGLERSHLSLSLCHAYFLQSNDAEIKEITHQQALWIYAIFTASLLLDVGKVAVKQYISLCNEKGIFLKQWKPLEGLMTHHQLATHYKIDFEPENKERLRYLITPLLARQLLPVAGFNWIASDDDVLEAWLAILSDDQSGGGLLPMIIPLADALLINTQMTNIDTPDFVAMPISPTEIDMVRLPKLFTPGANVNVSGQPYIPGASVATVATATTSTVTGSVASASTIMLVAGIAFLLWLRKGIANGQLSVNSATSLIHRTKEGIVILPKVFAEFSKNNPQFKDPHMVAQQFSLLELSGREQPFRQITNQSESRLVKNAIVIPNVFNVFSDTAKLPAISETLIAMPTVVQELPAKITSLAESMTQVRENLPNTSPQPKT